MDANAISGFTGDQSQQGQGLAYVLPQSRTTGYFMQLANEQAQQRRDDAALLAQQQQKANEQYAQHLYATKTPEIAKDYTQYLQPKFDDLLTQMADYHSKTGLDPYTNPDYIKQFNDLSTVAKNTHEANVQHTAYAAQLADKSKNYTPESKQAGIDWLNAYHKNPVSMLYSPPPALEQRNLDMNDAIKLGHPNGGVQTINGYDINVPNRHGHIVQGQTILNQPEFAPLLQSRGINPTIGDIGGIPNGTGGTLYPTDAPHVNAIADQILQNAQQPHYAATLHAAGIDPLDPHAKDKLTEIIQRQNAGYGKVYGEFADRLDADIAPSKRQNLGEDRLGISEANLELARQRLALQQEKEAQKNAGSTYVQTLAERSRNNILSQFGGDTPKPIANPFPELENLYINNPKYKHSLKPSVNQDGTIQVNVPAEYKYNDKNIDPENPNSGRIKIKDAYTATLDPNNPEQFKTIYGQLFDQATGEKTGQPSKINTVGGKGHVAQPHGKVATMQQIQAKVGTKGFEGYTAQELADYYKGQGYTINP